jgi:hypothetical protein
LARQGVSADDSITLLLPMVTERRGSASTARREVGAAVASAQRKFPATARENYADSIARRVFTRYAAPPPPPVSKTTTDWDRVEEIALSPVDTCSLWDASPIQFEARRPDYFIETLYPQGSLICCSAAGPQHAETLPRDEWIKRACDIELIVPSPMTAPTGTNQEGRTSPRCLANTGPRRYLVVEFDFAADEPNCTPTRRGQLVQRLKAAGRTTHDACAALLLYLASIAPLALVVSSGGKSLHGWFRATDSAALLDPFMRVACAIGADAATFTPCQMVRCPDGRRHDTGKPQHVIFFNPECLAP